MHTYVANISFLSTTKEMYQNQKMPCDIVVVGRDIFFWFSLIFSTFDTHALDEHFNGYKHLAYDRGKAECIKEICKI